MTRMKHSKSYKLKPPAGPAGENLFWTSGKVEVKKSVAAWYSEVTDCKTGGPTSFSDGCAKHKAGKMTGHFTAMVWKGVKEIGCATNKLNTLAICRFKAGDTLSMDTPNMNRGAGNYVKHVFPRTKTEKQCGGAAKKPAGKKTAGKKPAGKKPAGKKPAA